MTTHHAPRFAVAPHFHLPADWPRCLQIADRVDADDAGYHPRPPWRAPEPDELRDLVNPHGAPEESVLLFNVPVHLREQWWQLVDGAEGNVAGGCLPGFELFVNRVADFL